MQKTKRLTHRFHEYRVFSFKTVSVTDNIFADSCVLFMVDALFSLNLTSLLKPEIPEFHQTKSQKS